MPDLTSFAAVQAQRAQAAYAYIRKCFIVRRTTMPNPTNLEQLQEQKAQESYAAAKLDAVRHALAVLTPQGLNLVADYLTLVARLHAVLEEELATLTAPTLKE